MPAVKECLPDVTTTAAVRTYAEVTRMRSFQALCIFLPDSCNAHFMNGPRVQLMRLLRSKPDMRRPGPGAHGAGRRVHGVVRDGAALADFGMHGCKGYAYASGVYTMAALGGCGEGVKQLSHDLFHTSRVVTAPCVIRFRHGYVALYTRLAVGIEERDNVMLRFSNNRVAAS